MFNNRVGRLIFTVIMLIAAGILCVAIINPLFMSEVDNTISSASIAAPMVCFAFAIIVQVAWDILNFKFLNNFAGKLIKRILFFLAFAISIAISFGYHYQMVGQGELIGLDFFPTIFISANAYAPIAVAVLYTLAIINEWDFEQAPFIPLYAWGGSVVCGLITAIFAESEFMFTGFPIIVFVAGIAFMVIFMIKQKTFIFGEAPYRGSYSGGYSSSGSYNSGYSGGSSSSDDDEEDKRGQDGIFFSELKSDFYRIASNNSTSHSLGYGATVTFDIDMSTYGDSVEFTVNGRLSNATFNSEFERDTAQHHLEKATQDCINKVFNEAQAAVRRAQNKYKDYDNYGSISVNPGSIS